MRELYDGMQKALGFGELWIKIDTPCFVIRWDPDRNHRIEWRMHEIEVLEADHAKRTELMCQRIAENMRIQYREACGVKT